MIASRYSISVQTLNQWKKKFLENAALAFDVGGATNERDWAVGKLKSLDLSSKKSLVDSKLDTLSMTRQCQMLELNRSTHYYQPVPISEYDLKLMRRIDEIYTDLSVFYGYRRIHAQLRDEGWGIGHNKVHRLMGIMGIEGQRPKRSKKTSIKDAEHAIYPYLLHTLKNDDGQVVTTHPNQIWSGDITYIPVQGGFMYLAAIIDWHSKAVLAWRLSNTMDASLVTSVLEEANSRYGTPEIFNSDQGSYEKGYVKEYENIKALRQGIEYFIGFYNFNRLHSALDYDKPMNVYLPALQKEA